MLTLADDSGLEVDALNGAPGVRSARYAPGSDADRSQALLTALAALPPPTSRRARFRCVLALIDPRSMQSAEEKAPCTFADGCLEGEIAHSPRGERGFGYDPIFLLPDGRHLAEISAEEKNKISHRGEALRVLIAQNDWLADK